jgi:hypothetical protein
MSLEIGAGGEGLRLHEEEANPQAMALPSLAI